MKNWILGWTLSWFAEKSTWAGFLALAASQGLHIDPGTQNVLIGLAVSFFAMPDRNRLPDS